MFYLTLIEINKQMLVIVNVMFNAYICSII